MDYGNPIPSLNLPKVSLNAELWVILRPEFVGLANLPRREYTLSELRNFLWNIRGNYPYLKEIVRWNVGRDEDFAQTFERIVVRAVYGFLTGHLYSSTQHLYETFPEDIETLKVRCQLDMDIGLGDESDELDLPFEDAQLVLLKFTLDTLNGSLYDFLYEVHPQRLKGRGIMSRKGFELWRETHKELLDDEVFFHHLKENSPQIDISRWRSLINKAVNLRNTNTHKGHRTVGELQEGISNVLELLGMLVVAPDCHEIRTLEKFRGALVKWQKWSAADKEKSQDELRGLAGQMNQYWKSRKAAGHKKWDLELQAELALWSGRILSHRCRTRDQVAAGFVQCLQALILNAKDTFDFEFPAARTSVVTIYGGQGPWLGNPVQESQTSNGSSNLSAAKSSKRTIEEVGDIEPVAEGSKRAKVAANGTTGEEQKSDLSENR